MFQFEISYVKGSIFTLLHVLIANSVYVLVFMKFWHLLYWTINKRQQQVKMLPWAGDYFFPAAPWTNYILLACFSHAILILLCSRYWKIPSCFVVFIVSFFHSHTHCNSLTLVGDKHVMAIAVVSSDIQRETCLL